MKFRTEKQPLKVSVTGIDGAGKDTVTEAVLADIARSEGLVTAKLGRPSLQFEGSEVQDIFPWITGFYNRCHLYTQEKKMSLSAAAVNALYVLIQARALEPLLERDGVDLLATIRDSRIDPAIHMTIYGPGALNSCMSLEQRIRLMQRLTHTERDAIFWLNADPRVAFRRVRENIEVEQSLGTRGGGDIHETADNLQMLSLAYRPAMIALRNQKLTPIIEVDTTERTVDETIGVVKDYIGKVGANELEPNEWVKI